jgi:hypothetical protein
MITTFETEFLPFGYEQIIPLLAANSNASDVELSLYGQPAAMTGISPDDVHIYLNEIDLTTQILTILRESLDTDANSVSAAYANALNVWFATGAKLGAVYPGDLGADQVTAKQLVATKPSNLLDQLGNRRFGGKGNLHIFNFLFKDIVLPSVSMKEAVSAYSVASGTRIDFPQGGPWSLTLSAGPCRLYNPNWSPTQYGGRIVVSIAVRHDDLLQQAYDLLTTIQNELVGGAISDQLGEANTTLNQINTAIASCDALIGSDSDIQSVNASLNEIKNVLKVS